MIDLFATAARAAGPDLNRRTFVTALSKIKDFPGTVTPVLSYGPDKRYGPTEYKMVKLHNNVPPSSAASSPPRARPRELLGDGQRFTPCLSGEGVGGSAGMRTSPRRNPLTAVARSMGTLPETSHGDRGTDRRHGAGRPGGDSGVGGVGPVRRAAVLRHCDADGMAPSRSTGPAPRPAG